MSNTIKKQNEVTQDIENKPLFNAWISPTGKIIEVDIGYHSNYVIAYIEEQFGKEYLLTMKTTSTLQLYKFMEDQNWIRVTNWRAGEFQFVIPNRIGIPQCQKKAIANICIEYNIPMPDDI